MFSILLHTSRAEHHTRDPHQRMSVSARVCIGDRLKGSAHIRHSCAKKARRDTLRSASGSEVESTLSRAAVGGYVEIIYRDNWSFEAF